MNYIKYIILVGAGLLISWMILGDVFWHPNDYLLMDGGDGYLLYFNAYYHVNHGSGVMLSSMNYPDPECIFMTDAQGVVAVVLERLSQIFPAVKNYIAGVFHSAIIISIVAQLFFLFFLLRRLKIETWLCIFGAILIGALAPQLVRPSYGHFGLCYPFLIPMALWWMSLSLAETHYIKKTVATMLVFLLLGINNPYLIVIVCFLLLAYAVVESLYLRRLTKPALLKVALGVSMLLIIYLIMHLLDPYEDRIGLQWGHFYYASTLRGLFAGKHSLFFDLLPSIFSKWEYRGETLATISLSSTIILFSTATLFAYRKWNKANAAITIPRHVNILLIASLLIFLYSSAMFQDKHWMMLLSHFEFISMVKASGRLSWIPYYTLSMAAIVILNQVAKLSRWKYLIPIFVSLWSIEGYLYLNNHCKTNPYPNHLRSQPLAAFISPIADAIDLSNYQGVYNLPVVQSWNDNLLTPPSWDSEKWSYKIASATGIPLINSRLSRAPVDRSLANIQLSSHPLIKKELLDRLDPEQRLLIIQKRDYTSHTTGEAALVAAADTVYQDESVIMYDVLPGALTYDNYVSDLLRESASDPEVWYFYEGFDHSDNDCGYIGSGSAVQTEWADIVSIDIPDTLSNTNYELSLWSKVNIHEHGMPFFNIKVIDASGTQIKDDYVDSRNGVDTQNGWIRSAQTLQLKAGYKVILRGFGRYEMCIDEVMLRPVSGVIAQGDSEAQIFSLNNYKLFTSSR